MSAEAIDPGGSDRSSEKIQQLNVAWKFYIDAERKLWVATHPEYSQKAIIGKFLSLIHNPNWAFDHYERGLREWRIQFRKKCNEWWQEKGFTVSWENDVPSIAP